MPESGSGVTAGLGIDSRSGQWAQCYREVDNGTVHMANELADNEPIWYINNKSFVLAQSRILIIHE